MFWPKIQSILCYQKACTLLDVVAKEGDGILMIQDCSLTLSRCTNQEKMSAILSKEVLDPIIVVTPLYTRQWHELMTPLGRSLIIKGTMILGRDHASTNRGTSDQQPWGRVNDPSNNNHHWCHNYRMCPKLPINRIKGPSRKGHAFYRHIRYLRNRTCS